MIELIISGVNIFILFFFIGYIASPMIAGMMAKRRQGIADTLEGAKNTREDAAKNRLMYEEKLKNFEQEREAVLAKAQQRAAAAKEELMAQADEEAARIIERAEKEAVLMQLKLQDDIRNQMVDAGVKAAACLIADNMSEEISSGLIDSTLNEMGEATWQS